MMAERALTFDCAGEQLVAIIAEGTAGATLGVIVLVGGPQYRVGSHRQFVLLARRLSQNGIPVMRFDYRGMGDSGGRAQTFESVVPDIAAAVDRFKIECPSLRRVVLWGLCDAASAALLFWETSRAHAVAGLVLLNPWIRSDVSIARTHIKHYYGRRLLERDFWTKLVRGHLDIRLAMRSFVRTLMTSRSDAKNAKPETASSYQDRMAAGLTTFGRPVLLLLSGNDLTAKEFVDYTRANACWRQAIHCDNLERHDVHGADHTFSTREWRQRVEDLTLDWLKRSFDPQPSGGLAKNASSLESG